MTAFQRVLVPYDGSAAARRALELGVEIARLHDAVLFGIVVEAHLPHYPATIGEVEEEELMEELEAMTCLRDAVDFAELRGVPLRTEIRAGNHVRAIVEAAREHHADLIVVGHASHSGLLDRLIGGLADRVGEHAACSVLIAR